MDRISHHRTERVCIDQSNIDRRLLMFFGDEIETKVTCWTTAHGDFHWANLTSPHLNILDWEGWGKAPAGLDIATLYCYSLLVPEFAEKIYELFQDPLEKRDGLIAQLYVITRLLKRVDQGELLDLAGPLHRHARQLLPTLKTKEV